MRPADVPSVAVFRVLAECERRARLASPDGTALARRTFARLDPADWTLEWQLPVWLGEWLGVEPAVCDRLVVANVLGLASVRIQDDVADGEVADDELAIAAALGPALLDEALSTYRDHFDAGSALWPAFDRWMADWRTASRNIARPSHELALRGAPLKVPAYAVCLLAGRLDVWPRLERCLDHALTALVLYDQFVDWEDDLAAGRWNAFVASVTDGVRTAEARGADRRSVLAALMSQGPSAAYFGRVRDAALAAAGEASAVGCAPLAGFLEEYAARTDAQGREVEAHYGALGERAATIMFGGLTAPLP